MSTRRVVGVLALLLVGAGFWWQQSPKPGRGKDSDAAPVADSTDTPAPRQSIASGPAEAVQAPAASGAEAIVPSAPLVQFDPAVWPALPAETAPLNEIMDALRTRADQGDHKAACRLALELAACDAAIGHLQFQEQQARRRADLEPEQQADLIRDMEDALKRTEGCDRVAGMQDWDRWRYARQAAQAGNVAAMELYAFDATRIVLGSRLTSAQLKQLLGERDAMLMAAARAGSGIAVQALIQRLSPMGAGLALDPEAGLTEVERAQIVEALRKVALAGEKSHLNIKGLDILNDQEFARVAELERHFTAMQASLPPQHRVVNEMGANAQCEAGYQPAPDLNQAVDWRREFGMIR